MYDIIKLHYLIVVKHYCLLVSNYFDVCVKVEEATVRAAGTDKDHRKELDAMLSSLGVAPVSGTCIIIKF